MTKKKAREHYGCDNLKGMELDYKSSLKHVASLWSWRNAKDELMNSANAVAGGYYTALTMATFHDMKFYSANWGMEEPMSWGHKAGCGFIEGSCLKDESVSNYPNAFCTGKRVYCSTDHFALSKCDDTPDINTDPKSPCPILLSPVEVNSSGHFRSSACTELGNSGFPDFLTGENSMCLSTDDYDIKEGVVPLKMSGVCALVSCDESHRKVQVKYKGNDRWHDCPEGKKITVETSASLSFKTITCPQYTEVCTIAFNGSSRLTVNDPSGHPTPPSGGANGGGGGNNNVGGDGCATVAPIALAAVVLMVITPML
ncbi:Peptidase M8 [Trypanosoma melophagium]|uniref:Peptidase M8 n=1 Tax=Trypanosoma melophagium TaxID=715481 RepID=UPI00351A7B41|nr:Peptidase M8 [Trypanosoma melophagium]KAH9583988.1 Peptidase M8 [Trypanosoma melophagium]KAH9583991.1 Peptidase M8 [Trypanosoma melophagium]KAH9583992.1 Peptidase M8 [Trypanosoma melophagium]KAH9583996.1 Peptidase M8 [Trypanosoma melophagium]